MEDTDHPGDGGDKKRLSTMKVQARAGLKGERRITEAMVVTMMILLGLVLTAWSLLMKMGVVGPLSVA